MNRDMNRSTMGGTQPNCWHLAGYVLCLLLFFLIFALQLADAAIVEGVALIKDSLNSEVCTVLCLPRKEGGGRGAVRREEEGREGIEVLWGIGMHGCALCLVSFCALYQRCVLASASSVYCCWPPSSPHSSRQHLFDSWLLSKHS